MNPSSAEILYLQILRLITIVRLLTGLEHEVRTQYGFPVSERAQTLKPNQCATHSSNINAVGTDVVCPHIPQSHVCSAQCFYMLAETTKLKNATFENEVGMQHISCRIHQSSTIGLYH